MAGEAKTVPATPPPATTGSVTPPSAKTGEQRTPAPSRTEDTHSGPSRGPETSGETKGAPAAAAQGAKAPFYVLVDFVSATLYEGEPLTACLRVENLTSAEAECEVRAEVLGAEAKVLRADTVKLKAAAGGFGSYQKDHDLSGARTVRLTVKTPLGELPGAEVQIARESDPWPETKAFAGRLTVAATGAALVPVVRRRAKQEDRTWAPIRWALGLKDQEASAPVKSALLLFPGAWSTAEVEGTVRPPPALVPEKTASSGAWVRLGPYALEGVAPVLLAAGDILRAIPKPAPDRVVILLPPEDVDGATDPRLYRIMLECLLSRLAAGGVKQTVLWPPFRFGVPERRQKLLWEAAHDVAQAYGVRAVAVGEFLAEGLWRLDANTPGVYGKQPNAEGQKKIGQTLSDLLP